MNLSVKVVTQMPLQELWREHGFSKAFRLRSISADDIKVLLRTGSIQFVVADVGSRLRWIPLTECFDFWKAEAQPHLASPNARAVLGDFPDGYCYFASEWSEPGAASIVLLEKHH